MGSKAPGYVEKISSRRTSFLTIGSTWGCGVWLHSQCNFAKAAAYRKGPVGDWREAEESWTRRV